MRKFTKINADDLMLGMRFSAPVFFDDGENMFLAENRAVKPYHLEAIKRWNIKSLLTYGHLLADTKPEISDFDNSDDFDDSEYTYGVLEEIETV